MQLLFKCILAVLDNLCRVWEEKGVLLMVCSTSLLIPSVNYCYVLSKISLLFFIKHSLCSKGGYAVNFGMFIERASVVQDDSPLSVNNS